MSTLAEYFDAFMELVERGECKRAAARDDEGNLVSVASPKAARFCPLGAAIRVTRGLPDSDGRYEQILDAIDAELPPFTSIAMWADDHAHAEVVELCKRARIRALATEALADERNWVVLHPPRALAICESEDEPVLYGDELVAEAVD